MKVIVHIGLHCTQEAQDASGPYGRYLHTLQLADGTTAFYVECWTDQDFKKAKEICEFMDHMLNS